MVEASKRRTPKVAELVPEATIAEVAIVESMPRKRVSQLSATRLGVFRFFLTGMS